MSNFNFQGHQTKFDLVQLPGVLAQPGATTVTATLTSAAGNITRAFGATTPTDGEAGYATGCYFIDSDGGLGATAYVNEGSSTSCSFRPFATGGVLNHPNKAAINSSGTATAAQVATGYITSTSAAGTTITLPTGTLLGAALGAVQGTTLDLYVDNTAGASTVTMAVAVNGILSDGAVTAGAIAFGDLTIAAGVTGVGRFTIMFSSPTAYVFSRTA